MNSYGFPAVTSPVLSLINEPELASQKYKLAIIWQEKNKWVKFGFIAPTVLSPEPSKYVNEEMLAFDTKVSSEHAFFIVRLK